MTAGLEKPKDSGKTYCGAISSTTNPHMATTELNMDLELIYLRMYFIFIENGARVAICVRSTDILLT
jgi:hypothetical protein